MARWLFLGLLLTCSMSMARTYSVPETYQSIQAAIDVASPGDTIEVGPGVYDGRVVILTSGLKIVGAGSDVVTIRSKADEGPVLVMRDVSDVCISGCTFEHSEAESSDRRSRERTAVGGLFNSTAILRDCRFQHGADTGFVAYGTEAKATLSDCHFSANRIHGLIIGEGANCSVELSEFSRNGGIGFAAFGEQTTCVLNNNTSSENGTYGIRIGELAHGEVVENMVMQNVKDGIMLEIGAQGICRGNQCESNGENGIRSTIYTTDSTLINNTCQGNGYNGIIFTFGSEGMAESNTCSGNSLNGIAVVGLDTSVTLSKNVCTANRQSGIRFEDGGAGTAQSNTCRDNRGDGILVTGEKTRAELNDNTCENNSGEAIARVEGLPVSGQSQVDQDGITWLFEHDRFDVLENMATTFRNEQSHDQAGIWRLNKFYEAFREGHHSMTPDEKALYLSKIECWKTAYPNSVTPLIAMANFHLHMAFDATFKYPAEPTDEDLKIKKHELALVTEALKAAESLEKSDPEIYMAMMSVALDTDDLEDRTKGIDASFKKGIAVAPYYIPLYENRFLFSFGDGEHEAFAQRAVELTRDKYGEALYGMLVIHHLEMEGIEAFLSRYNFSWERLRAGFEDYIPQVPESREAINAYCFIACYYDAEIARSLFAKIAEDWDKDVWRTRECFDQHKAWIESGQGVFPRPPKPTSVFPHLPHLPTIMIYGAFLFVVIVVVIFRVIRGIAG